MSGPTLTVMPIIDGPGAAGDTPQNATDTHVDMLTDENRAPLEVNHAPWKESPRTWGNIVHRLNAILATESKAVLYTKYITVLLWAVILYGAYRGISCDRFKWECKKKGFEAHYDDGFLMLLGAFILAVTGPTVGERVSLWALFFLSTIIGAFAFGGLGELAFMKNDLSANSAWKAPAAYLYIPGTIYVCACSLYGLYIAKYRTDRLIWAGVALAIGLFYLAPYVLAVCTKVATSAVKLHPHHYMLAAQAALLLRKQDHMVVTILRAIFIGVYIQGISAYGAASLLKE